MLSQRGGAAARQTQAVNEAVNMLATLLVTKGLDPGFVISPS